MAIRTFGREYLSSRPAVERMTKVILVTLGGPAAEPFQGLAGSLAASVHEVGHVIIDRLCFGRKCRAWIEPDKGIGLFMANPLKVSEELDVAEEFPTGAYESAKEDEAQARDLAELILAVVGLPNDHEAVEKFLAVLRRWVVDALNQNGEQLIFLASALDDRTYIDSAFIEEYLNAKPLSGEPDLGRIGADLLMSLGLQGAVVQ